ncbi:hypothetical protein EVAR_4079_1 [Eumeta japonica]|uniref:Uncharacterized protein n=1 Tax=Eumeta variegata TaxID=151549 RepID=A0A4C1T486_EUMVA|nr:hypothetical protein EVAR_4079_1 [Eumeta japonica]
MHVNYSHQLFPYVILQLYSRATQNALERAARRSSRVVNVQDQQCPVLAVRGARHDCKSRVGRVVVSINKEVLKAGRTGSVFRGHVSGRSVYAASATRAGRVQRDAERRSGRVVLRVEQTAGHSAARAARRVRSTKTVPLSEPIFIVASLNSAFHVACRHRF